MPYIGKSPSAGVRQRYQYTATAGQTTFTGTDLGNLTLTYTDNNFVDVYQNGVLLKGGGNDYTATSGTSVVLGTGATADDVIEIIVYDAFSAANFYSRTDSDSRYQTTLAGIDDQSSSNDDQITITDSTVVINEDSDDVDFRVESNGNANMLVVNAGDDKVGVGTDSPTAQLEIEGNVSSTTQFSGFQGLRIQNANGSAHGVTSDINLVCGTASGNRGAVIGSLFESNASGNDLYFATNPNNVSSNDTPVERVRISAAGLISFFKSSFSETADGVHFDPSGLVTITRANGTCFVINRQSADGTMVDFRQANSTEGFINISGSTVSYNGFSGLHESSGIANNVAIGTVVSTIDELDVYPSKQKSSVDNSEEDHPKAGQTRADHAKIKISDSVGDKRVYGVLQSYNANGKPLVASVGIGSIRVTGACEGGDLLESNGDGTAKVQSDDIIRSKTIGKVTIGNNSTDVKLVSCVLYCG